MKELSMEEKAKAYDEVREKIAIRFGSNVVDEIFSQFEMSEDERIRKGLIEYFLHYPDHEINYYGLKADSVIAWLEKQKPIEWSDYDRCMLSNIVDDEYCPLDIEEKEWLKSLRPQPKVEWSKEDERIYQSILDDTVQENQLCDEQTNWLKSLRLRNYWKPSEKQINSLEKVLLYYGDGLVATEVKKLLEQLKAL